MQKQADAARCAAHAAGDKEARLASLHRRDLEALAAVQQQVEALQQQQPELARTQVCRGMLVKNCGWHQRLLPGCSRCRVQLRPQTLPLDTTRFGVGSTEQWATSMAAWPWQGSFMLDGEL